jgi:hypothetical protein
VETTPQNARVNAPNGRQEADAAGNGGNSANSSRSEGWGRRTEQQSKQSIEQQRLSAKLSQQWALAQQRVVQRFGFVPNPTASVFENAVQLRANSNVNASHPLPLPMPTNIAFHDLTPGKIAPRTAKNLLGLGGKFIVIPHRTNGEGELFASTDRLERDFHLKVYFAGAGPQDQDREVRQTKLFVKSEWRPEDSDIPYWVDARLSC